MAGTGKDEIMIRLIIRRLLWMVPVLFTTVSITFLMMHAVPLGPWDKDPARLALTQHSMDDATREALNRRFGLDKPLWRQFIRYIVGDFDEQGEFVCGMVCGNLGPSYRQRGFTVQDVLFGAPKEASFWQSRFGYSIRLGALALAFAIAFGIPLGVTAALKQNTFIDHLLTMLETLCVSVPNFVIGLLLVVIVVMFNLEFIKLVPRSWSEPKTWLIPVVILGLDTMASTARLTRTSMLETMHYNHVRTARSKGLAERVVIRRHILRNALIPVVTMLGPSLAELIASSFVIEMMFGFPGMGRVYITSIQQGDYTMILGATLIYAVLVTLINLGVDLTYNLLDPRIQVT
jgi:oligopeptide transport system permease protein